MAFETKEEVLERVLEMDRPKCPYCERVMNIWEVPPITYSDGLGWGTPYLFICFNDECSLYTQGWDNLKENYSHTASYRCMNYPGTEQFELIPVFSPMGARGQIIDDEAVAAQEALQESIKRGFSVLADCYVSQNGPAVLRILLDPTEPMRVRLKAADMIGDIGEIDAVDALRNIKVGNQQLQKQVETSIHKIHERFYTRECPFCAEVIKARAKVCKHCGREIAGR